LDLQLVQVALEPLLQQVLEQEPNHSCCSQRFRIRKLVQRRIRKRRNQRHSSCSSS